MNQNIFDNVWKQAEAKEAQGQDLPDGVYDMCIDHAEFRYSQSGNPGVSWQFSLVDKPKKKEFKWNRLRQHDLDRFRDDAGYLKKDLSTLGLECDSLDMLDTVVKQSIKKIVRIEIKTKGTFRAVNILEEIRTENKRTPPSTKQRHTDPDEVPF